MTFDVQDRVEIFDHLIQIVRRADKLLKGGAFVLLRLSHLYQIGKAENPYQRCAEIMRSDKCELFQLIVVLNQFLVCLLQFLSPVVHFNFKVIVQALDLFALLPDDFLCVMQLFVL